MDLKKILLLFSILAMLGCEPKTFKSVKGKDVEISSVIGKDVFDVVFKYSKALPETLKGTNNERWVVYYSDIDVTFETKKTTNKILKAKKGKNPKSSTWAK